MLTLQKISYNVSLSLYIYICQSITQRRPPLPHTAPLVPSRLTIRGLCSTVMQNDISTVWSSFLQTGDTLDATAYPVDISEVYLPSFSTFSETALTLFRAMFGDFDFDEFAGIRLD